MFEENQKVTPSAGRPGAGQPSAGPSPAPVTVRPRPELPQSPLREESEPPASVQDIFETAEPVGPTPPVPPTTVPMPEELEERPRAVGPRLIIFVIIGLIILGLIGWLVWQFLLRPSPAPAPAVPTPSVPTAPALGPPAEAQPSAGRELDSDQDRLTDEDEARWGTDPFNPDTDNDNLNDYEEVRVFRTDPLDPDSDGDGFLDGDEVSAGYDPNKGGGTKLLNLEQFLNR